MELEQVGRVFGEGDAAVHALADATLQVHRGDYLSIMGPSGSGKSTLLNIMALLDRQTSGAYRFDGVDAQSLSEGRRTGLRAHRIGFVFQAFHLLAHRDVTENVIMSMLYNRMPRSSRRSMALEALDRVGLSHRADFLPTKLSGGERQRVAIARAIAPRPTVLLCDEPTGNLDQGTGRSILDLFEELRASGLTVVVVTHDPRVGLQADRIVEVEDGLVELLPQSHRPALSER
ncbi:MAG: ABC transporter ATP-binding protein [Acidimicrobiaceae bacterium]|nr:ABC transporter ATP-binding protein [Acidimicrobiaceae bacterium]